MGFSLHLIGPLLLISSSLANPIPLERAAPWTPEDIGILEQNAPETTTQLALSGQLTCDNSGAERCLLFPIGCLPGVNCTDRLEMRRVDSGSNIGDIIIALNLHVSRTAHMLVAVPMPDISNPNSTFLVGCSIDDAVAVVAKPDVDGVTEQIQLPWLRLVAVRATSSDLECIVSASPGFVDLPLGDVAVFAGDLLPEEEVRQPVRIASSLDEETMEEKRDEDRRRENVEVEPTIQKISSPLPHERTTHSLEHSESTEPILVTIEDQSLPTIEGQSTSANNDPILVSVEDQRPSTTTVSEVTTVPVSKKPSKLRLKPLHSSESSSAERSHRHSSAEKAHSTHASVHHETTSTTTTTTSTEVPVVEESTETTTETPSTQTPEEESTTTEAVEEKEQSTTVHSPHHHTHHGVSHEHHKEQHSHSHERASVDKEHHSVRMEPTTTTTTAKPPAFENDKDVSEEDKQLMRAVEAGLFKEEGEEETVSTHADGTVHHRHATVYELSREAAQDPIGRRPSEHSHSHDHSHELRAADTEEEEEEDHTKKKEVTSDSDEEKKEEREGGVEKGRERMGEKKHQRRSEEKDEDEEEEEEKEDEDDSTSSLSLMAAMIICLAPLLLQ